VLQGFQCQNAFAHGILDHPNPDSPLCRRLAPTYRGSGLRNSKMHKHFVTRISDIPMTQMPINQFLAGLSPMALIVAMHPPLMDGPDFSGISRLMMSQLFQPEELRFPDAEYPDSLRISDTCLPKRMAQIFRGFHYGLPRYLVHGNAIS
jgi:hypothetical protein